MDAFKNDPAYAKKEVKATQPTVDVTFTSSKSTKTVAAVPGSSMAACASRAGVKIAYNCKNGECGTCEVLLNGNKVIRTCQFKVPKSGCKIMTKN